MVLDGWGGVSISSKNNFINSFSMVSGPETFPTLRFLEIRLSRSQEQRQTKSMNHGRSGRPFLLIGNDVIEDWFLKSPYLNFLRVKNKNHVSCLSSLPPRPVGALSYFLIFPTYFFTFLHICNIFLHIFHVSKTCQQEGGGWSANFRFTRQGKYFKIFPEPRAHIWERGRNFSKSRGPYK